MNKEIKEQWIEALRSGEYLQGKHQLKDGNTFCCLGVLTDLAVRANVGKWYGESWHDSLIEYSSLLPPRIQTWSGMETYSGAFLMENGITSCSLSQMNDEGKSFEEISEVIAEKF